MRERGDKGETLARRYLIRAGFCILSNNFSVRGGEIDLIARAPDGLLVFFEVKLRAVEPEDCAALLPFPKRRALARAARAWCARTGEGDFRFDLLVIVGEPTAPRHRVVWFRGVL